MLTLTRLFKRQCQREWLLTIRQSRSLVNGSLFFLLITIFFPLTLPAEHHLLRLVAPGFVWIATLLAMLLSAERIFQQDFEDGVIEQWLVSGYPVSLYVLAKTMMHWGGNVLPILLFTPFLGVLYTLSWHETMVLLAALALGSPCILLLCALSATFGIRIQHKGLYSALILLPLTIPVMVFGSATVTAAMQGLPVSGYLALLFAMSLFSMSLLPFAISGVMRFSLIG